MKDSQNCLINQFIAEEISGLIKSRFDPTLADKLMDEVEREPEWLVDMMKKPQVLPHCHTVSSMLMYMIVHD